MLHVAFALDICFSGRRMPYNMSGGHMAENNADESESIAKQATRTRIKLRKSLPTDRVAFQKQMDILRAIVVASGHDRNPVSNDAVAKVINIHANSISNCNPFFLESGLLTRHKMQNIPCDEVFAYAERHEWDSDKAAHKLAPVLRKAWFCSALVPKLSFRPLPVEEAIGFLAEESGATKGHKDQLLMIIEYMKAVGIVTVDGGVISLVKNSSEESPQKDSGAQAEQKDEVPAPKVKAAISEDGGRELHPFITGLLKTLPEPETEWTIAGRIKWLQTASGIFGLIYKTSGNENEIIEITKKQI